MKPMNGTVKLRAHMQNLVRGIRQNRLKQLKAQKPPPSEEAGETMHGPEDLDALREMLKKR